MPPDSTNPSPTQEVETKRCYVCGREGTRLFCWVKESRVKIAERFGGGFARVGGFYECSNKSACRRRQAEQRRGYCETDYP